MTAKKNSAGFRYFPLFLVTFSFLVDANAALASFIHKQKASDALSKPNLRLLFPAQTERMLNRSWTALYFLQRRHKFAANSSYIQTESRKTSFSLFKLVKQKLKVWGFFTLLMALTFTSFLGVFTLPSAPAALAVTPQSFHTWVWPTKVPTPALNSFVAPEHPWSPGKRGVEFFYPAFEPIYAPFSGQVNFAGQVAGTSLISLTSGSIMATILPVSTFLKAKDFVTKGQLIGHSLPGRKCRESCLYLSARLFPNPGPFPVYLDPLNFLPLPKIRLISFTK